MMCIVASYLWTKRKVMSRVLQKNKPVAYAASQDFINAILCDGLLILSKKHNGHLQTVASGGSVGREAELYGCTASIGGRQCNAQQVSRCPKS
jgi:hypothetical protein